jgi:Tol biopolymer transport system component
VRLIDELPVSMFALSFSSDGKWLAGAGVDRTVYIWDVRTWTLTRRITGQPEMISALAFSPDGRRIATGGFSELTHTHPVRLIVWDVATAKQVRAVPAPRRVAAVTFSPDGKHVASSSGEKSVNVWEVPD